MSVSGMRDWTEIHREIRETLTGCGMRDLSATGGSGIRQNLGTDVRLGKKTFFGRATTKEVGVRDQDSPFQTLTPGGEGYSLR